MKVINLYITAGCNGAGKTTTSFTILPEMLECKEFVNAAENEVSWALWENNKNQSLVIMQEGKIVTINALEIKK